MVTPGFRRLLSATKVAAFTLLERPRGPASLAYHGLIVLTVLVSVLLSVIVSARQDQILLLIVYFVELVILPWLALELGLRLWAAGCKTQFQGVKGRFLFLQSSPLLLVDLVSIVASSVFLTSLTASSTTFPPPTSSIVSSLRWMRLFQILRMFRIDRRAETWQLLGKVVFSHWHELLSAGYIGVILLLLTSLVVFRVEGGANPQYGSWADSLWWTLITFYSVGYGDISPATWLGKLLACLCSMLGIVFFSLPAGILGSGFALKAQEQARQAAMDSRRLPAAALIQSMWRLRAASDRPLAHGRHSRASWPTRLLARQGTARPATRSGVSNAVAPMNGFRKKKKSELTLSVTELEAAVPTGQFVLTPQIKGAILMLRRMKYFSQKKHMKRAMKPYDVMDIVESYSAGHTDLAATVKQMKKQVGEIETCLTRLVVLYQEEDRQVGGSQASTRLLSLPSDLDDEEFSDSI